MIIQIIQEVIASPILGTPGLIYVITAKEFIESSKLKTDLKHLDILVNLLFIYLTIFYLIISISIY